MTDYGKFKRSKIDTSCLEFFCEGKFERYFCTPVGAKIIGRAGVDGVHFCSVDGFGEIIFSVSPMDDVGNNVHAVAKNFKDFLRLLISLKGTAAISQFHMMRKDEFYNFFNRPILEDVKEIAERYDLTGESRAYDFEKEIQNTVSLLKEKFSLIPMEDPFSYMVNLDESFPKDSLKFHKEYNDLLNEKEPSLCNDVYFKRGFFNKGSKNEKCEEIKINKYIHRDNIDIFIPSIYLCPLGIMLDICCHCNKEKLKSYLSVFEDESLTDSEKRKFQNENVNPIYFDGDKKLIIDKNEIHSCSSSYCYYGSIFNMDDKNGEKLAEKYFLDRQDNYSFERVSFKGDFKKSSLNKIELIMIPDEKEIFSLKLDNLEKGKSYLIKDSFDKKEYKLKIKDISFEKIPAFKDEDIVYPDICKALEYELEPKNESFVLKDSSNGDNPRDKNGNEASSSCCVGIILKGTDENAKIANSAFYFEEKENISWDIFFTHRLQNEIRETIYKK